MSHVRVSYPALSKMEIIEKLKEARIRLRKELPVLRMILYGSYALDRHTAGSDIDLLVVYDGKQRKDAYKLVMTSVDLPRLEPKVYTQQEFNTRVARSKKFSEILEKEGIVIS